MTKFFRLIAFCEGLSYLAILFVTMPMKYMMDMPEPTYYVGMAHGVLFIAYVGLALIIHFKVKWDFLTLFLVMLASLLPFGTFIAERKIFSKLS